MDKIIIIKGTAALAFIGWLIGSWLTHVVFCIQTSQWGFLIAGAVFAPVGVVHGTGLWFGFFGG